MKRRCGLLVVALASGLTTVMGPRGVAGEPSEPGHVTGQPGTEAVAEPTSITMRGETKKVWPFDDLRARGYDVPDIPREENAFWAYLQADNTFKELPTELRRVFDYAVSKAWPVGNDEQLGAYVLDRDNQRALEVVRRAAGMEKCQFYYFGDPNGLMVSLGLVDLTNYRQLAKLLIADGRRLEEQGAYQSALDNYVAVLRMGHHIGSGITLIEKLVGVSLWDLGDRAIAEFVLRRDLPADELAGLLDQLKTLDALRPSILRGARNERLFSFNTVDDAVTGLSLDFRGLNGCAVRRGVSPTAGGAGWCRLARRLVCMVLPDRTIKQHMGAYFDAVIRRAAMPAYEARWNDFDEDEIVSSIPRWDILARMLLPSLSRAGELGERCRMQAMMTRLTVALGLYMADNGGRPPSRLDQLGEWIPADDLVDPFSGRQFIYQAGPDSWRLYSVGENMIDDGGTEGARREGDYVLRYPSDDVEPFVPPEEKTEPQ
jgi:hypothetical protein